jgi:endonuclease/exonuclease/phosphatase (EEP) superfamily protein YafD
VVAWTPAVMCAGWALLRVFGLDSGYPAVPLATYTLYVLMVAALATIVALGLRQWPAAALAALAMVSLAAVIAPRAIGGPDSMDGVPVRVMSANVFRGGGDADTLVQLASQRRVDLLCVEELTPEFADRLDAAGIGRLFSHRLLSVREGVSGSGIYSRYPLRRLELRGMTNPNHRLASTRASATLTPGVAIDLTAVHNIPVPASASGVDDWASNLGRMPTPTSTGPEEILAGDFNATLDQSDFRDLLDRGYFDAAERMGDGLTPTWPAIRGRARYLPVTIDHILYDRDRVGVRDFQVLTLPDSDHRTIYAELILSPPASRSG